MPQPRVATFDSRTIQSTPESDVGAGRDGRKRRKMHAAVDTLGHLLALIITPANAQDLLPRRWVVERSFVWTARFWRLARDYEQLPETVVGLDFLAFACLLHRLIPLLVDSP